MSSSVFLAVDRLAAEQPAEARDLREPRDARPWVTESFSLKDAADEPRLPPSATSTWVAARSVRMGGTSPTRLTKSGDEFVHLEVHDDGPLAG